MQIFRLSENCIFIFSFLLKNNENTYLGLFQRKADKKAQNHGLTPLKKWKFSDYVKTTFLKSKKPSFSYTTSHYTKFTTMWKWHFYSLKSFLFYKQHHKNTCLSLFQRKTDSKEISNFWLASHAGVFRGVRWKTSSPKNVCVGG